MKSSSVRTKFGAIIGSAAIISTLALGGVAFAQTTATPPTGGSWGGGTHRAPGVFGTVASISGDTITVTSKGFGSNATAKTYTVDATNATVTKAGAASSVSAIADGDTLMVQGTVSGTNVTATTIRDGVMGGAGGGRMMGGKGSGVMGTVASVSGNSLTVTSKAGPNGGTATTYTVDATNATVTKAGAASTVSAIATGDTVMVQGTVSGTSVTATKINDGVMGGMGGGPKGAGASVANITGNGEPIIGGTVASISGTSLTVTNKSNVTYTVDTSNATVNKGGATSTVSAIATGDAVIVQGTVNGNAVVASSVIDQGVAPTASTSATPSTSGGHGGFLGGLLGGIGGFFQHLFGF